MGAPQRSDLPSWPPGAYSCHFNCTWILLFQLVVVSAGVLQSGTSGEGMFSSSSELYLEVVLLETYLIQRATCPSGLRKLSNHLNAAWSVRIVNFLPYRYWWKCCTDLTRAALSMCANLPSFDLSLLLLWSLSGQCGQLHDVLECLWHDQCFLWPVLLPQQSSMQLFNSPVYI